MGNHPGVLRRTVSRLATSAKEHEAAGAAEGLRRAGRGPGRPSCRDREQVRVAGTLRTVTLRPRAGVPALVAELYDGSGSISLVWLGRRQIPGIEPGRAVIALRPGDPRPRPAGHLQPALRAATGRGRVSEHELLAASRTPAARRSTAPRSRSSSGTGSSTALGGRRGMVEGAVPTLGFTVTYLISHDLRARPDVGIGLAVALLVVRLVQRQPVQFVVNSLVGIGIAAVFAVPHRQGRGRLPAGHHLQRGVRRRDDAVDPGPLAAGRADARARSPATSRPGASDPAVVRLCSKLTWMLARAVRGPGRGAVPALPRPARSAGSASTKIALGWPLQVAALAADGLAARPRPHPAAAASRSRPPTADGRARAGAGERLRRRRSAGVRGEQLLELRTHVGAGHEQQLVAGLQRVVGGWARSAGPRG